MPLIIAKLLSEDTDAELVTAIDDYKAGAGAELLDTQRGMASFDFVEPDGDLRTSVILAHGGLDIPASGAKTADLQHVSVTENGDLAECQAALDEALSNVVHIEVTDGDADAVANDIASASAPFEAEDVGRKVSIGGDVREITAYVAATSVTYDGDPITGTGLTVQLLGAEVLQDMHMNMQKKNGKFRLHALLACEGEAY
jgi:hypothetical protein